MISDPCVYACQAGLLLKGVKFSNSEHWWKVGLSMQVFAGRGQRNVKGCNFQTSGI